MTPEQLAKIKELNNIGHGITRVQAYFSGTVIGMKDSQDHLRLGSGAASRPLIARDGTVCEWL